MRTRVYRTRSNSGHILLAAALLTGCKDPVDPLEVKVTVEVRNEAGATVAGASVTTPDGVQKTDSKGRVDIKLRTAELAVISNAGSLEEPVVIGRGDAGKVVAVKLWNAGGKRWVMHSAGDVMFGRRYSAPTEGEPLIKPDAPADGARHVVSAIAPAFIAADVRTVNLETVVSGLGASDIYPGKRFILNSPPQTLAGLDALGVDAIDLANNHGRDYLTRGIDATHQALADYTLPHFGQAARPDAVPEPLIVDANGGVKVGMLGWTTVEGSFVNDSYPIDGQAIPADILPEDMWQYQPRTWGFEGATWSVPSAPRRIGSAWRLFSAAEPTLSRAEANDAWTQLSAVYPELQDWVQRRGHAGAAGWDPVAAGAQIAAVAKTVDLVVVQLHAGFQFQPAPSAGVRLMARAAIDAGAGLVVCHHPHVLQGVEWYKGKLIIYSLGNFIFDQDFGATFSSMFLRTIWDGNQLLEARLVPLELEGYRPRPTADEAAMRNLRRVWEMSTLAGVSERDSEKAVRVFATTLDANTKPATLRLERNTAVITAADVPVTDLEVRVPAGQIVAIGSNGLVDPRLADPDLEIGRELLQWGGFEDNHADNEDVAGAHWNADSMSEAPTFATDAFEGIAYLKLTRTSENKNTVLSRPVARVTLLDHRLYRDQGGVAIPLDPAPRFSFRMRARLTGSAVPGMRVDLYNFNDSDPTEDPTSVKIGRVTFPFDLPRDGEWHVVELPIAPEALIGEGGLRANQLMPYVQLDVPASGKSRLDVDALEIIEWRRADAMPDRFGVYDFIRNTGTRDQVLRVKEQRAQ
jgi:poly-gamma-glutamate capsule biosynthesis protein CapA/YwtB (metallophosphatase superfamily)